MRAERIGLVAALMNAAADATGSFIIHDPAKAASHSRAGFEAMSPIDRIIFKYK